nr:MAG: hypothetical protein 1 [Leviviridae sp.]
MRLTRKERKVQLPGFSSNGLHLIVEGRLNNLAELQGLRERPEYIIRPADQQKPVSIALEGSQIDTLVTEYTDDDLSQVKRLRELVRERKTRVQAYYQRYRTLRREALARIRMQCRKPHPRFRFVEVTETRTAYWRERTFVPRDMLAEVLSYPEVGKSSTNGRTVSGIEIPEKLYRKLTGTVHLELKGNGMYVMLLRSRQYTITKHKMLVTGTYFSLDRELYGTKRADWLARNPVPPVAKTGWYRELSDRIYNLGLKSKNRFHEAFGITTNGHLGNGSGYDVYDWLRSFTRTFTFKPSFPYLVTGPDPDAAGKTVTHNWNSTTGSEGWREVSDLKDWYQCWRPIANPTEEEFNHPFSERWRAVGYVTPDAFASIRHRDLPGLWREAFASAQLALMNLEVGKDDLDGFNAFRSVAELKDFGDTSRVAREFLSLCRLGRLGDTAATLKACASAYLTYKFAVKPTISDIKVVMKSTRGHLLQCRRGLWNTLKSLQRLKSCGMTVRKYVPTPRLDPLSDDTRELLLSMFPSTLHRGLEFILTDVRYGLAAAVDRTRGSQSPVFGASPSDGYRQLYHQELLREVIPSAGYGDSIVPVDACPFWCVATEKALYFARINLAKLYEACDPSRISNLVQTMQLPKTLWELFPLSFVVDWFANTANVASNVTRYLSGWCNLIDSGDLAEPWCSMKSRLYLVCPVYKLRQGLQYVDNAILAEGGTTQRFRWLSGCTCEVQGYWELDDVKVIPTGVSSFARTRCPSINWTAAFRPSYKLNLGVGKITSLVNLLIGMIPK